MRGRKTVDSYKRVIDLLTPNQLRMVKMTFTGASNEQIAYLKGTSLSTVKETFRKVYRETGARNRPHLAALVWWEIEGKAKQGKGKGKGNNGNSRN